MASTTKPRSIVYWNSSLKTNVRHGTGHEAYCACGWVGHLWKDRSAAELERSFHRCASEREG